MLYKLKYALFLILSLLIFNSCQNGKIAGKFGKSNPEKIEKKKADEKKKRREEYNAKRLKAREKHYNNQAESTKKNWDINKSKSEAWVEKEFHKKPLSYRIKKFFKQFDKQPKPEGGLYSKKQLKNKNRKKRNIFQRIFKPEKKKKRK